MAHELDVVQRAMRTPPADVEGVIRELGIAFQNKPMPEDQSGCIEYNSGRFTITVNAAEDRQRQRFTAAHELAHYLLHRDMLVEIGGWSRHTDSLFDDHASNNPPQPFEPAHEVQANKLAAEILMPRSTMATEYDPKTDNVDEVAQLFQVSAAAMKVRLKSLGLRDE